MLACWERTDGTALINFSETCRQKLFRHRESLEIVAFEAGALGSGLSTLVADDERLSRFVVFRRWLNVQEQYVKAAAFLPD